MSSLSADLTQSLFSKYVIEAGKNSIPVPRSFSTVVTTTYRTFSMQLLLCFVYYILRISYVLPNLRLRLTKITILRFLNLLSRNLHETRACAT